jgi:hypothetical protein
MVDQVGIYTPENYIHSQAFNEVANGFRDAFLELNLPKDGRILLFGGALMQSVPGNFVIYQTEQVQNTQLMTPAYINTLRTHEVWDYSLKNIEALEKIGIKAKYVPVGYMPSMRVIKPAQKDIDILHYGSCNPRRQEILGQLLDADLKVVHIFNCYGAKRDAMIARAKIVINIHYYDSCIFEIFRVSHLMANEACVVSEIGDDAALEGPYRDAIAMCEYGELVAQCQKLLAAPEQVRREIALQGFNVFKARTQIDILKEVFADSMAMGI